MERNLESLLWWGGIVPHKGIETRKRLYHSCKAQGVPIYEALRDGENSVSRKQFSLVPRTFEERMARVFNLGSGKGYREVLVETEALADMPDVLVKLKNSWGETYEWWKGGNKTEEISLREGIVYKYVNCREPEVGEIRAEFSFDRLGSGFPYIFRKSPGEKRKEAEEKRKEKND